MYDEEATTPSAGHEGKADAVRNPDGKHDPVHLCFGHGRGVYPWIVGKGSGQLRDIQNDFTRFFNSHRRHDWVPVWYQTHAK